MKKYTVFISIILCFLFACKKSDSYMNRNITACGVTNPIENLSWLKELIQKAENDKTGNYYQGSIWLEKYKGKDIFVTNMSFGSGGIMYAVFDCQGNSFIPDSEFTVTKKILIYSNSPFLY